MPAEASQSPGDRVWYEPSEGARFSGVVLGKGSLRDTYRVLLHGYYWSWKNCLASGRGGRVAPAIAAFALHPRLSKGTALDEQAAILLAREARHAR